MPLEIKEKIHLREQTLRTIPLFKKYSGVKKTSKMWLDYTNLIHYSKYIGCFHHAYKPLQIEVVKKHDPLHICMEQSWSLALEEASWGSPGG